MSARFPLPGGTRLNAGAGETAESLQRTLKDYRYVVASVDAEALKAWEDLWKELKDGVTPAGGVVPQMEQGFKPSCGWAEFLEKFWLLKHYLDCIHRFTTTPPDTVGGQRCVE